MDILLADKGDGGEVVLQIPLVDEEVSWPTTIAVTGAGGSGFNGDYLYNGVLNGYPSFAKANGYNIFRSGAKWYVIPGLFPASWGFYAEVDTSNPPTDGWVAGAASIAPAPALDYTVHPYTTENGDPVPDTGIGTAVYTSLFTDAHWSDLIKGEENQVPSAGSFEGLLSLPITVGTVQNLQSAASRQLSWLKRDGVVGELSVEVSNPAVGRILVDIYTTRPNDAESRYQILWDQQEQKIIEVKRNG